MDDDKMNAREDAKQPDAAPKPEWKEVDQAAQDDAGKDKAEGGGYT